MRGACHAVQNHYRCLAAGELDKTSDLFIDCAIDFFEQRLRRALATQFATFVKLMVRLCRVPCVMAA